MYMHGCKVAFSYKNRLKIIVDGGVLCGTETQEQL